MQSTVAGLGMVNSSQMELAAGAAEAAGVVAALAGTTGKTEKTGTAGMAGMAGSDSLQGVGNQVAI